MRILRLIACALLFVACVAQAHGGEVVPLIAAASDLRYAMDEIAAQFQRSTGRAVKLSYGSSGNYYRQIQQGAPFELFMSADEAFVLKLHDAGKLEDKGRLYAIGRIVLYAPQGARWSVDSQLEGLRAALGEKRIQRFAIANPEHAPYGRAAEQALRKLGLWDRLRSHLVYGENVSQAGQFAMSGSAQGGLFAYSLALAPGVAKKGSYVVVPDNLHDPLRQRMALIKGAGPAARALYDYLQQPAARAIFERYGFMKPSEP
ncbi:MAG: molybdate ABC transporter substrate-binding protein [Rhodospirillaceae bacterium]